MLLSYGAKNFCCFKDWLEIDLSLNSQVPIEISSNLKATRALCIKGANASGKTNALKALSFIAFFCANSFSQEPDKNIPFEQFFDSDEPSEFYARFEIANIEYLYELTITKKEVISEKIFKKEKRKTLIFERAGTKVIKNFPSVKNMIISERKNASSISIAKQFLIPEFEPFYEFFKSIVSNVTYTGLNRVVAGLETICKFYKEDEVLFSFTKKYLLKFDTGIVNVQIKTDKNAKDKDIYYPVFYSDVDGALKPLGFNSQSRGTQELFQILALYFMVLRAGGVLILDEFDVYLHPDILPHLVTLFINDKENSKNSQLIFSTHNTEILDTMGKYRTVIVNKEKGKCFAYRLDEVGENVLRNDRPISPIYKTGKLGGIPKI